MLPSGRVHVVPAWAEGGSHTTCKRHLGKGWRGLKPEETFDSKNACRDCIVDILLDSQVQLKVAANAASGTIRPEAPATQEKGARSA